MINKTRLITPLLFTLLMTAIPTQAEELIDGRLFIGIENLPSGGTDLGSVMGNFPGMQVWVTTSSKDGKIYTGNVLEINYRLFDKDRDWADKEAIRQSVKWFYMESDGKGGYVPVNQILGANGFTYKVKESDVDKIIGVTIEPRTAIGSPTVPTDPDPIEVFDVTKTYALVPQGLEANYGNRAAGTIYAIGSVINQNNITDVEIKFCSAGENCQGTGGGSQEAISAPGIYIYDITGMETATLGQLDEAGRRFTQSNKQHASVSKTYRAVVFDDVNGVLTDITQANKAGITWSLQERGQTKQLFTKVDVLKFETQKTNEDAQARSQSHGSEQGLTIKVSVKTIDG